jgi:diaminopimelate epimerase
MTVRVVQKLMDRHFGIGGDQLLLLEKAGPRPKLKIFNSDGSQAEMCGNGVRAVAYYLTKHKGMKKDFIIDTKAGPIGIGLKGGRILVDMGQPILEGKKIPVKASGEIVNRPLKVAGKTFKIHAVSMGNPHCVIYVDNVEKFPVREIGPMIETHPFFPKRVNVEFVQRISRSRVKARVWERGAGETLACGTGACAIGVAAAGGAVDTYRYQHGKSMDLGEYEGDGEYGDAGLGDYGDIGDDGSALAAEEYADADLRDAEAMGEGDLSEEEIAAAEMGRPYYAQRFRVRAHRELTPQQKQQGCSQHAGAPGRRHGWLIYWIGFENFQKLAKLPESERRGAIEHMKNLARQTAQNVLASGSHTATMTDAETSGLLVAA